MAAEQPVYGVLSGKPSQGAFAQHTLKLHKTGLVLDFLLPPFDDQTADRSGPALSVLHNTRGGVLPTQGEQRVQKSYLPTCKLALERRPPCRGCDPAASAVLRELAQGVSSRVEGELQLLRKLCDGLDYPLLCLLARRDENPFAETGLHPCLKCISPLAMSAIGVIAVLSGLCSLCCH